MKAYNYLGQQLVLVGAGGGGGGISFVTVREVDGSPSVNATIIEFDQADGFVVSQPVVGTARVNFSGAGTARRWAFMMMGS